MHHWLKNQYRLPKSKSTPVGLTAVRTAKPIRPDKTKSKSATNIQNDKDKMRVQVVYKPPFKFSLKLRKPEKNVVLEKVRKTSSRPAVLVQNPVATPPPPNVAVDLATVDIDSNIHTVQSDLDVLLSDENDYVDID